MKEPFIREVVADDPDAAFELMREETGKVGYNLISDDPSEVLVMLRARLRRCEQNRGLYADQVKRYTHAIQELDGSERGPADLARALLISGDVRVDHPSVCGIISSRPGTWLVFGFTAEPAGVLRLASGVQWWLSL